MIVSYSGTSEECPGTYPVSWQAFTSSSVARYDWISRSSVSSWSQILCESSLPVPGMIPRNL